MDKRASVNLLDIPGVQDALTSLINSYAAVEGLSSGEAKRNIGAAINIHNNINDILRSSSSRRLTIYHSLIARISAKLTYEVQTD